MTGGGAIPIRHEKDSTPSEVHDPSGFSYLETNRLGLAADSGCVTDDKRLYIAPDFPFQIIGHPARQMAGISVNEQNIALDTFYGSAPRLMDDKVRYTAYRYFYTRTNAGLVGEFGNAAFDPAFMAVEEILHLALRQAGRHRDAQALAAWLDAQRQPLARGFS